MSDASWFVHELSCPNCAGDLELVSKSAPDIYHSSFVVHCPKCNRDASISVKLVLLCDSRDEHRRGDIEHGTDRGYAKHLRRGDPPCEPCRQAHSIYMAPKNAERKLRKRMAVAT